MPETSELQMSDLALQIGALVLKAWQADKVIRMLEQRVKELEPVPTPPPQE
jgi:hypothetical protein